MAIPDRESAEAVGAIKQKTRLPLVADIHFDYRLALICMEQGIDKVRINPGNIGSEDGVRELAVMAKNRGIPIRIGVNSGSLAQDIINKYKGITAEALVESAVAQAEMLERFDFKDLVISIKATDVFLTIEACRMLAQNKAYPQHIGMTEAGTEIPGTVKSAIGISTLLREGIGDTFRVSLTGNPVSEVVAAREILRTLKIDESGVELISCPTCGRCKVDLIRLANEVEQEIHKIRTKHRLRVAVMGCAVNGPGEAKEADVGIAGANGSVMLFKKGVSRYRVPESEAVAALMKEIRAELETSRV